MGRCLVLGAGGASEFIFEPGVLRLEPGDLLKKESDLVGNLRGLVRDIVHLSIMPYPGLSSSDTVE